MCETGQVREDYGVERAVEQRTGIIITVDEHVEPIYMTGIYIFV